MTVSISIIVRLLAGIVLEFLRTEMAQLMTTVPAFRQLYTTMKNPSENENCIAVY